MDKYVLIYAALLVRDTYITKYLSKCGAAQVIGKNCFIWPSAATILGFQASMSDTLLKGPGLQFITLVAVSALSWSCSLFTFLKKHSNINCLKYLFNCTCSDVHTNPYQ